MNLKNLRIVVDEREKKSGIPDLLKGTGINLEIKTLPVGDYIVAPETIVERKTVSDFHLLFLHYNGLKVLLCLLQFC